MATTVLSQALELAQEARRLQQDLATTENYSIRLLHEAASELDALGAKEQATRFRTAAEGMSRR